MSAVLEYQLLPERAVARPATWADRPQILQLLAGAEFLSGMRQHVLDRLFSYHWVHPKPNLGYVLTAADRVVGFIGAVYSRRTVGGRQVNLCGLSTLYVDPAYRQRGSANPLRAKYSQALIEALVSQANWTFVGFSPSPVAASIHHRLGFRCVSETRWAFVPGRGALATLLRGRHVHADPGIVLDALPEGERAIARDHLFYGCRCYAIECDGEYSLAITKRSYVPRSALLGFLPLARARRGHLPASSLLYLGNREAARARWHELTARVLLAERTAALVVSDWMSPVPAGSARRIQRYVDILGTGVDLPALDAAYSELALL